MSILTAPAPPPSLNVEPDPDERLFKELARTEGKAEIVHGKVVLLGMSGPLHAYAAQEIVFSIRARFGRRSSQGMGLSDGTDFKVNLPGRRTFRPDASFYTGANVGLELASGAPAFAAEVRSLDDYGPKADQALRDKRREYFVAGTLVVWDVDLKGRDVVRVYRDGNADTPATVFRRGDLADAEPAVPGWTMPVDDLFPPTPPPADA